MCFRDYEKRTFLPKKRLSSAPLAGGVLTILRILKVASLTYTRVRVKMQKFAFKSPVNAWLQ